MDKYGFLCCVNALAIFFYYCNVKDSMFDPFVLIQHSFALSLHMLSPH